MASKRAQGGPKEAPRRPQEGPKRAPGGPQEGSRGLQECPKRSPRGSPNTTNDLPSRHTTRHMLRTTGGAVFRTTVAKRSTKHTTTTTHDSTRATRSMGVAVLRMMDATVPKNHIPYTPPPPPPPCRYRWTQLRCAGRPRPPASTERVPTQECETPAPARIHGTRSHPRVRDTRAHPHPRNAFPHKSAGRASQGSRKPPPSPPPCRYRWTQLHCGAVLRVTAVVWPGGDPRSVNN